MAQITAERVHRSRSEKPPSCRKEGAWLICLIVHLVTGPLCLTSIAVFAFELSTALPVIEDFNMWCKSVLAVAVLALHWPTYILATAQPDIGVRGDNICWSGIYGELTPILRGHQLAQAFCNAKFPPRCTSAKSHKRCADIKRREAMPNQPSKSSTTKPSDKTASAWSKCQQQPYQVISTLCSCIQTHEVRQDSRNCPDQPALTDCSPVLHPNNPLLQRLLHLQHNLQHRPPHRPPHPRPLPRPRHP